MRRIPRQRRAWANGTAHCMAATSNCDVLGTAEPQHVLSTAYHNRHPFVIGVSEPEASLSLADSVHGIVLSRLELLLGV